MKKFDYQEFLIEKKYPFLDKYYPMLQLQELGKDGWEVVTIIERANTEYGYGTETKNYYWHVLLKREIE